MVLLTELQRGFPNGILYSLKTLSYLFDLNNNNNNNNINNNIGNYISRFVYPTV